MLMFENIVISEFLHERKISQEGTWRGRCWSLLPTI